MRRQDIIDAIKTRLSAIDGINNVYEWTAINLNREELPAVIIRDVADNANNDTSGSTIHNLNIEIDIVVSAGDTSMQDLRVFMLKVLKSLEEKDDEEDIVCYREFSGDEMISAQDTNFYAGARLKVLFKYAAEKWEM
ncbi:MAG: hypothetical protein LBP40_04690 [Campylobacteraceae bacterium]|nr:hypothetical protein [Campylobacteraceae bacterium]